MRRSSLALLELSSVPSLTSAGKHPDSFLWWSLILASILKTFRKLWRLSPWHWWTASRPRQLCFWAMLFILRATASLFAFARSTDRLDSQMQKMGLIRQSKYQVTLFNYLPASERRYSPLHFSRKVWIVSSVSSGMLPTSSIFPAGSSSGRNCWPATGSS